MAKYRARVTWSVSGYLEVEADSVSEAEDKVEMAPLPEDVTVYSDTLYINEIKKVEE